MIGVWVVHCVNLKNHEYRIIVCKTANDAEAYAKEIGKKSPQLQIHVQHHWIHQYKGDNEK